MNPQVLRRFVKLMAVALLLAGAIGLFAETYPYLFSGAPGDFYVRKGDQRLNEGDYEAAIKNFNLALEEMPDHRGALMGRALVFIQTEDYAEAIAELDYLIDYLEATLEPDDGTGRGVLAAAYTNRGIIYDRRGEYEKALADYIAALQVDEETVSGPDLIQKLLYGSAKTSTVRDRARYIHEQLQLPETERLLRIPEIDAQQRMYKP